MDVSWSTVICSVTGSIVASGIFSGVFSGVVAKIIQCTFDKKLANQKRDIQKMLDEHQIQFKYWHEEKAKAIKDFYSLMSDIYYEMRCFYNLDEKPLNERNDKTKLKLLEQIQVIAQLDKSLCKSRSLLFLFLEEDDDSIINKFIDDEKAFTIDAIAQVGTNCTTDKRIQNAALLNNMRKIMKEIRTLFQTALKTQDANSEDKSKKEQNKSPICADTDSSKKDEAK